MEISRRHLQDIERAELRDILVAGSDEDALKLQDQLSKATGRDLGKVSIITAESPEAAAEMQRQVDGMTRNQRRVLIKRMKKAKK